MRPTEWALGCALALLVVAARAEGAASPSPMDGRYAMGSILEITLVGVGEERAKDLFERLYREVARLEALTSRHDEASALSEINRGGSRDPLDPDLRSLLELSKRYQKLSQGAFDISVGAWVTLWTRAANRNRLPDMEERERARTHTGAGAFEIADDGTLRVRPGVQLDLGAIAKGYAIDRLADWLGAETRGDAGGAPRGALLNFGQSSYWAIGAPADADAWRLLLRHPGSGFAGVVALRDQALSVSSSFGQSSWIEGQRYGHVIDPRSGEPLHRNAQVAVLAPNAAMAEALSTAALVMGAEAGLAWVESLDGCEALWLDADRTEPRSTSGWQRAARYEAGVK